jgi:transposase
MAISKDIRSLAIEHHKAGKTPKEISHMVFIKIPTIRRWIREFKDGKATSHSPPGRPRSASNTTNTRAVKRLIRRHSQRNISPLLPRPASRSTVQRIVKRLNLKVILKLK